MLTQPSKHKIYFVIGAAGSGKTTALQHLQSTIPKQCVLIHFDSIGVPSFEEMKNEYGSIEQWQRNKTLEWVKKIEEDYLLTSNVIFDAQCRPAFISEACDLYNVDYEIILFDCSNEERAKRLNARGHAELADAKMMNWAAFLRTECQKHHHKIINNTHISVEQTYHLFITWLEDQISVQVKITPSLVTNLISIQFPKWAHLSIREVEPNGWDNKTFRLGDEMSVRLPSGDRYAANVEKEQQWLPKLAMHLSTPIPLPIAMGKPSNDYPWHWSIYKWLEGESLNSLHVDDVHLEAIAAELAQFLSELHLVNTADAPTSGAHNFFRGACPTVYDVEMRSTIDVLHDLIDVAGVTSAWERAIASKWTNPPVWIHGDLSSGNILIRDNKLHAIIDFGCMGVGDPACDLVIAWTLLKNKSRKTFKSLLKLDADTWARARGWALWKAVITIDKLKDRSSAEYMKQQQIISEILEEHLLSSQ